ncbi:hypothetical protein TrVGV298_011318 [Trichoderma virens]|nr:hypothetical protein TrVGV298_011318 [Trichoderma virens]
MQQRVHVVSANERGTLPLGRHRTYTGQSHSSIAAQANGRQAEGGHVRVMANNGQHSIVGGVGLSTSTSTSTRRRPHHDAQRTRTTYLSTRGEAQRLGSSSSNGSTDAGGQQGGDGQRARPNLQGGSEGITQAVFRLRQASQGRFLRLRGSRARPNWLWMVNLRGRPWAESAPLSMAWGCFKANLANRLALVRV